MTAEEAMLLFMQKGYQLMVLLMIWAFRNEFTSFLNSKKQNLKDLSSHVYIRGVIGAGKTTLLFNLFLKFIKSHGVIIVSTHGLGDLLKYIPEKDIPRTYVISPHREQPSGINLLQRYTLEPKERYFIADAVVNILKNLDLQSWGSNMGELIYQAVNAILEAQENNPDFKDATLYDVYLFLREEDYRNEVLRYVKTRITCDVFSSYHKESMAAAVRRMGRMLSDDYLVATLCRKDGLNISKIVADGDILIVDLNRNEIGDKTASFIAEVFMSKMYTIAQYKRSKYSRHYFAMFDEFQTYSNDFINKFVEEGRKVNMPIVLAHQRGGQLTKSQEDAVQLCRTWYIFQLIVDDAKAMAQAFPKHVEGFKYFLGKKKAASRADWEIFVELPLYTVVYRELYGASTRYGIRKTRDLPKNPPDLSKEIRELNEQGKPTREEVVRAAEKGGLKWEQSGQIVTSYTFSKSSSVPQLLNLVESSTETPFRLPKNEWPNGV